MNEAERLGELQDALADMREDIRTHAPNHKTDPAHYLLASLTRRGLRLVTEDEWQDQFEHGEEEGRQQALDLPDVQEAEGLAAALEPRWPG